jgi:hypothetical protein
MVSCGSLVFVHPSLMERCFIIRLTPLLFNGTIRICRPDAFAIFQLDEEGQAKAITMKAVSPATDFSFDFQDLDLKKVN